MWPACTTDTRSALDAVLEGIYLPKKAVYLSGRLEDLLPADLPLRAKGGRPTTNPFWEMPLFGKGLIIAPAVWGMLPVPGLGSAPPRGSNLFWPPLCAVSPVFTAPGAMTNLLGLGHRVPVAL